MAEPRFVSCARGLECWFCFGLIAGIVGGILLSLGLSKQDDLGDAPLPEDAFERRVGGCRILLVHVREKCSNEGGTCDDFYSYTFRLIVTGVVYTSAEESEPSFSIHQNVTCRRPMIANLPDVYGCPNPECVRIFDPAIPYSENQKQASDLVIAGWTLICFFLTVVAFAAFARYRIVAWLRKYAPVASSAEIFPLVLTSHSGKGLVVRRTSFRLGNLVEYLQLGIQESAVKCVFEFPEPKAVWDDGCGNQGSYYRGHMVKIHQYDNFDMKLEVAWGKTHSVDNDVVFFGGSTDNQGFCVKNDGTISPHGSDLVLGIHATGRLVLVNAEDEPRRLVLRDEGDPGHLMQRVVEWCALTEESEDKENAVISDPAGYACSLNVTAVDVDERPSEEKACIDAEKLGKEAEEIADNPRQS